MAHASSTDPKDDLYKDCPDSLQDLCMFYCMNNLDILVKSLYSISDVNDDTSSIFSMLLGNKMLEYFLRFCVPSEDKEKYVDELMQTSQLCNELCITRRGMVNAGNVQELANNSIKKLQLTVFDDDIEKDIEKAYRHLVEKSPNLTNVSIYQKCEEFLLSDILNLLCGKENEVEMEELDPSKNETVDSKAAGDCVDTFEIVVANTKYCGFQIRNLNAPAGAEAKSETGKPVIKTNQFAANLKSFSYEQVYTTAHRYFLPSFGWFYQLLSDILLHNKQLQSFSLVTSISNPVEWFMSQPKLAHLKNLQSLCLSYEDSEIAAVSGELEIAYSKEFFSNLPVLENLRHLDISCGSSGLVNSFVDLYKYDDSMVKLFIAAIKKMPKLKSLDISGTNLSAVIGHTDQSVLECKDHCMPGFEGRKFEYIGLYRNVEACRHKFIPALKVSGDASIDQLLVALWSLQHNKAIMTPLLRDIQEWTQAHFVTAQHGLPLIDGLIAYMTRIGDRDNSYNEAEFYEEKNICSILHSMYFLLRNDDVKKHITLKQKRQLTEQLLVICHSLSVYGGLRNINQDRNKIVRIGMLLILILDLETVVVYSYRFEQYIQVLMAVFNESVKQTTKMLSLRLLHSACRFNQELKAVAGGKMQLVKKLLMIVMNKVMINGEVDEIMEKVWSILWTLTDEVPSNCEMFVTHGGCLVAKTCIEKYRGAKSLHRKISGAMNNVSENASLVPRLMTEELVVMFEGMLSYYGEEDYDVSSHAAGFLIMLASHGPEAWTVLEPDRDSVLEKIEDVMQKWDINKPKGVKFRSLNPMLTQIANYSTPVAQLWGAWLICNLVIVKPDCYCDMLDSENGLEKINTVLQHGGLQEDLSYLLEKIRSLTLDYKAQRARNRRQ